MTQTASDPPLYLFGEFRFDPQRTRLYRGAEFVALPHRLAQLLALLVRAEGAVVPKKEIAASIWPENAVSDGNLAQHVHLLRRVLEERARDRSYVLTERGRGYRFAAPVTRWMPRRAIVLRVDRLRMLKRKRQLRTGTG